MVINLKDKSVKKQQKKNVEKKTKFNILRHHFKVLKI